MAKPDRIRIAHEDFDEGRFNCIGRMSHGTQFMAFVTGAFPTGDEYYSGNDWQLKKQWLGVLHQFDAAGNHIGTNAALGGFEIEGPEVACKRAFNELQAMLANLSAGSEINFCDIWVRLFSIEYQCITHGLFYEQADASHERGEERAEWVMLQPCGIMFHPPWDSGEYSS